MPSVTSNCYLILQKAVTLPQYTFSGSVLYKELKLSRKTFCINKNKLEGLGLIKQIPKVYPPMYQVTKKGVTHLSYSTTRSNTDETLDERIGAEDIYITIPIGDNSNAKLPKRFWEKINDKLKNNVQKHTHIKLGDYNVSLRETTQSVVIQLGPVRLRDFADGFALYNSLVFYLFELLGRYNYWLRPWDAKCSDPEFTYSNAITKESAEEISKPRVVENLGFPREKLLPGDKPEETWVKGCLTPNPGTIESNHRPLAAAWRSFPLVLNDIQSSVKGLAPTLDRLEKTEGKLADNIEMHYDVLKDIKGAIVELKEVVKRDEKGRLKKHKRSRIITHRRGES